MMWIDGEYFKDPCEERRKEREQEYVNRLLDNAQAIIEAIRTSGPIGGIIASELAKVNMSAYCNPMWPFPTWKYHGEIVTPCVSVSQGL